MVKRCGVVVAIATLVTVAFGSLVSGSLAHGTLLVTVGRAVVGVVALIIISLLVFRTSDIKPPPGVGRPIPIAPSKRQVWQAYAHCIDTYDRAALGLMVKMLINLPQYLERINEDVAPQEEVPELDIVTHQVYRVGPIGQNNKRHEEKERSNFPQTLLVPLVLVEKGTLLDGFEVSDSSGCEVPTLSYNQTRGLLAYAIETIINIAPTEATGMARGERDKNKKYARSCLTTVVCAPGPRKKQTPEKQREISDLLKSIDGLPTTQDWKKRIRDFCETLADYYVIVAETGVPSGGVYVNLKYKQRVPLERSSLSVVNRMRSRFGLRFSAVDIPLNLFALGVEAYHLQMNATPMQYVYDHHLEWLGDTSRKQLVQSDLHNGDFKPYVRLHYNTAQPAMHLYIRRQFDPKARPGITIKSGFPERLKSVVEFREIPPGTLGAATVVSVITAVIISFFAITQIGQEPSSSATAPTVNSDIPALLLALPGVASLVIGSWLDLSRLRQASLATYLGLGVSAILSLASALYFLLNAYRVVPGRLTLWIAGHVAIKTDVGWLLLAGIAITSCLFLCRDLAATSRYYFQRVKARVSTAGRG